MGPLSTVREKSGDNTLFDRLLKIAFIFSCLGFVFAYGVLVGKYEWFPYRQLDFVKDSTVLLLEEWDVLTGQRPTHFLQPARLPGRGVTINRFGSESGEMVFLSGFFEDSNEFRLIRRDGTLVRRWPMDYFDYFPDPRHLEQRPATSWNVEIDGALIEPDGSVVFNFEYGGTVKLDRCGRTLWVLPERTHHSITPAESGGYWIPGRRLVAAGEASPYPPFATPFEDDHVLRVSADGAVVLEFPVAELFYRNGLEGLLTANYPDLGTPVPGAVYDLVHLNKIAELTTALAGDFPQFQPGDLVLSLRRLNLLMVVDPLSREVKWWRVGPWLRQHDPEFKPGGTLVVFSNNFVVPPQEGEVFDPSLRLWQRSEILEIDPVTDRYGVLYGLQPEQSLRSRIKGKIDLRPGGGLLIAEFAGGRAFEVNAAGETLWQYINAWGEDQVAEINEARVYPASFFTVSDWSCQ